jgi:hypothetical protein
LYTCEAFVYHKTDAASLNIHICRDLYRGPSRRLAQLHADAAARIAAARLVEAAQAVFNGTGTIQEWRQAYWAELAARTAATAIRRGFGHFRG